MKKVAATLALLAVAFAVGFAARHVWAMPDHSDVTVFRIIMIGFIPIPIPIGFFTSPHFWGGLLYLLAGLIAFAGIGKLRN